MLAFHDGVCEPGAEVPADEASAVLVCGFVSRDLRPFSPPIGALPRLLHLPATDAQETGYESTAAFARTFKRLVGQPPGGARSARRGRDSPARGRRQRRSRNDNRARIWNTS